MNSIHSSPKRLLKQVLPIFKLLGKDPSKLFWNEHDRDLIMPVSPLEGTLLQRLVQAATYL